MSWRVPSEKNRHTCVAVQRRHCIVEPVHGIGVSISRKRVVEVRRQAVFLERGHGNWDIVE